MSSNLIGLVIAALGTILTVAVAVGLPALAIVAVRFLKFKERELTLQMEHRQKSQEQGLAVEQRVQRLEETLTSLAHEVRAQLGMDQPATSADVLEDPAGRDPQRAKSLYP